jgi:hypothetical protein
VGRSSLPRVLRLGRTDSGVSAGDGIDVDVDGAIVSMLALIALTALSGSKLAALLALCCFKMSKTALQAAG